ncbi:GNAT family N-acetyltransferase [Streptomyces sp. NPDC090106]|uniref:GNAT family N-acetyltransferase n=1 Tax=Streptomyces sp. NPDC090106 TaxID=3365946 RepID=UPI0038132D43
MTTTLRPTEPLQRHADGTRSRHYQVCVNSRPVGAVHLATVPGFGDSVASVDDLRIEEPDRRRGRGTVAALAAEEIARGWGCQEIQIALPGTAEAALRLVAAVGYVLRNRGMAKRLGDTPPALPEGSRGRPMTQAEFDAWQAHETDRYARDWIARGVPEEAARAKSRRDHEVLLPQGLASADTWFSVLEQDGTRVGTLWLALRDGLPFVYDVEVDAAHRGRGHGRTLMLLAETQAHGMGQHALGLNVFADNPPAERLYESLGYETTRYVFRKALL